MKKFLSSLLFIFATMLALPAYADDPCKNLYSGPYYTINVTSSKAHAPRQMQGDTWTADGSRRGIAKIIPVDGNTTYTFSIAEMQGAHLLIITQFADNIDMDPTNALDTISSVNGDTSMTITTNPNAKYALVGIWNYPTPAAGTVISMTNPQFERGSTATTYQPYNPLCATCDGTVKESENLYQLVGTNYFRVVNGDTLSNVRTDPRTQFNFIILSDSLSVLVRDDIGTGNKQFNFTIPEGATSVTMKFSGQDIDMPFIYLTGENVLSAGTYTISFNVLSDNASYVDGLQIKDIQIERGDHATAYHPYGSTYCEPFIKIATTAYNDAQFAPVEAALESAVTTIKDVVANTIVQADAIQNLQDTKQTMPDASGTNGTCPRFRQCLLVENDDGSAQWFVIADPVRDLVLSLKNNKVNSSGQTTNDTFAANSKTDPDSRYYKGYPAMRLQTDAQSSSVSTHQFSSTQLNGANGGQYKELGPQEWAVTWDGNETGTSNSFLPGVIYGTSRCTKTKPASTLPGTEGWTTVENSDPLNDLANIESYIYCYCKMTGVGLDGMITPVRDSSQAPWVFDPTYSSAGNCASYCAYYCARDISGTASFRNSLMNWTVE